MYSIYNVTKFLIVNLHRQLDIGIAPKKQIHENGSVFDWICLKKDIVSQIRLTCSYIAGSKCSVYIYMFWTFLKGSCRSACSIKTHDFHVYLFTKSSLILSDKGRYRIFLLTSPKFFCSMTCWDGKGMSLMLLLIWTKDVLFPILASIQKGLIVQFEFTNVNHDFKVSIMKIVLFEL